MPRICADYADLAEARLALKAPLKKKQAQRVVLALASARSA